MNLTLYDDPRIFKTILDALPGSSIGENELMLGLTEFLMNEPGHYGVEPFLATVDDAEGPIMAAFMTPPWNILIYGGGHGTGHDSRHSSEHGGDVEPSGAVYDTLIEYLLGNDLPVPGVNGKRELSDEFSRRWCDRTGKDRRVKMEMKLFILRTAEDVKMARGDLVRAGPDMRELLLEWSFRFNADTALGMQEEFIRSHLDHIIGTGRTFVWMNGEAGGGPVCMAFLERPTGNSVSVGFVYTPPELRERGYATSCVAELSRWALGSGYSYLSLFTDLMNPTSNSIYRKIGYRPVCDYVLYDLY